MTSTIGAAIIGSGNIGTDLMIKVLRSDSRLVLRMMVGIDPESDGLARAGRLGIVPISTGVDGLIEHDLFADVQVVFDATSAGAHIVNEQRLRAAKPGIRVIDLTPAAIGPYCVPSVNLDEHLSAPNLNMVTCGGQATIPIVAAVSRGRRVAYAEIVASIASLSAGPGTRANIDEFTETTAEALRTVGGAEEAKAIIILNPAEPPLIMRDTVFLHAAVGDEDQIAADVEAAVAEVAAFVPGYRLKQNVQIDPLPGGDLVQVSVFLEVEGAAHYLPAYAGNLDIMTSAALRAAEVIADHLAQETPA